MIILLILFLLLLLLGYVNNSNYNTTGCLIDFVLAFILLCIIILISIKTKQI